MQVVLDPSMTPLQHQESLTSIPFDLFVPQEGKPQRVQLILDIV